MGLTPVGFAMLHISDLNAEAAGKPLLNGLALTANASETHAIMGPAVAAKSMLGEREPR